MRILSAVLPFAALLHLATAQDSVAHKPAERLLQASDVTLRQQTAKAIEEALGADKARLAQGKGVIDAAAAQQRLADLRIAAATALETLPDGSAADARVATAIEQAKQKEQKDGAAEAASSLRLSLAGLLSDLRFAPVREAELPKGFPDFLALDELEIRDYPAYRMVKAPMKRSGSMGSFWTLFNHIKKNEIAMTTPVQVDYEKGDERMKEQSMAFLYGDPAIGSVGADGNAEVVDVAAATVITVGARGYERRETVDEMHERLLSWLAEHADEYVAAGTMRLMNYNSPSVGGERRYFEIQIPVRRIEPKAAPAVEAKN